MKEIFELKEPSIAYPHKEITWYAEMLKLPAAIFSQSNS